MPSIVPETNHPIFLQRAKSAILILEPTDQEPESDKLSSNIFSLFKSEGLAANQTKELLTQPLVIQAGQELKAQASAGNQLHIVVSYLEIT